MRRDSLKTSRQVILALAVATLLLTTSSAARAQIPQPRVPDIAERSGLLQRFAMPKTSLPYDKYRDTFFGTRFGNHFKSSDTNRYYDGGLYGVRLPAKDTESVYPFFYGAPGKSTITPESKSRRPSYLRAVQQLTHQRKPVGMYYDRGSYVPIYDLDSFAPGPGPDYWPWFFQGSRGG